MTAVGLAILSAILFGGMTVALRIALRRDPDVELATVVTVLGALPVVALFAAAEAPARGLHVAHAWPFALAGLLSPGGAQILVTLATRDVGASRTSVVLGMAPLVAVTIALTVLGEPPSAPLVLGAVLIVAGAVELARERGRPEHLQTIGLLYAFLATVLFAIRDNIVRWLAGDTSVPPAVAAVAALTGGALLQSLMLGHRLGGRGLRGALAFLPVGVLFGSSYVSLFEAFYRGRVSIVSPLVATEALWGVLLAVVFLRASELVGRRLLFGAALVVAGGALIGVYR